MNSSYMAGTLESPTDMEPDFLQLPIKRTKIPSFLENSVKSSLNYESLFDNSKLFCQKLKEFNELHGISLARASVVGKGLDLYLLYKEVTTRGGFALVTKDGRWAEVVSALNFTSRVANPSIQLQHLYESLLYQFELIYCPGTQTMPDAPSGTLLSVCQFKKPSRDCSASSEVRPTVKRKLQNYSSNWSRDSVDLGYQVGNTFSGANESEVDSGYLVSAMVGAEKLNGFLYHSKYTEGKQFVIVPSLMDGTGLEDYDSESEGLQIRVCSGETKPAGSGTTFQSLLQDKGKLTLAARSSAKVIQKKIPKAPKGIRNAYQLFVHKECDRLKKIHGQSLGQNGLRRAIEAWNCLSENDRMPYIEESRKDKQRFDQEMVAYRERQKVQVEKVSCNPEPEPSTSSNAWPNDGYHVKLQTGESCHKLLEPDRSMVEFAAKMMEGVEKLDASLEIDLGEFLSIP